MVVAEFDGGRPMSVEEALVKATMMYLLVEGQALMIQKMLLPKLAELNDLALQWVWVG